MGVWADFKAFASRGNVVNVAVGFVIGVAFTALVTAFAAGIITPLVSLAVPSIGKVNETVGSVTFHLGVVVTAAIALVIDLVVIFFVIVYPLAIVERRRKARQPKPEPTTKECPFCFSTIGIKATRCAFCTSQIPL